MSKSVRAASWISFATLLVLLLPASAAWAEGTAPGSVEEEKPPKLPGAPDDLELPTGEELERVDAEMDKAKRATLLKAVKMLVSDAISKGGKKVSIAWPLAILHGALPECALYFNRESFVAAEAIHGKDPDSAEGYFDQCRFASMLLERRPEQKDEIRLAAAYGRLAHAWGCVLGRRAVDETRVLAATKHAQEQVRKRTVPMEPWKNFVMAAAMSESAGLSAWANAEAESLAKDFPGDAALKTFGAALQLSKAIALVSRDPKGAAALLPKLLAPLAAPEAIEGTDTLLIGLYNRGITAARRLKAPVKAEYRTVTTKTRSGLLEFDVPRGTGWVMKDSIGDQDEAEWVRTGHRGATIGLQIWKYDMDTNYFDDSGRTIGGDNPGGRIRDDLEKAKAALLTVKKVNATVSKLSKGITGTKGFDLRGTSTDGEVRLREWIFRTSVKKGHLLNVCMKETGESIEEDPEVEFVLASMREVGAKK